MSSTMKIQGGPAGESIKKKHLKLLQHFATAFVCFKEALIKASLPNFNFYWLGKWPPQ
jgi:hypothetical protein